MQTKHASKERDLIPVGEAAKLLGVSVDTVKRWEKAGRISSVRTPTGHRRFDRDEVLALLAA
ncbi:hypothetical protein IM25_00115 [Rhodococcus sp. p52]|uniref:MerR family transcriptional regulator n=1 Tax=Rhodococcus sp. p52 TaxID=935199 RepID=UPI00051A67B5|nr:helix-turn-helix domain-containing protein [Rhodococcus sp. p52]AOD20236.1 hypothetical protein IM25_00115 [Rhodococcus sp. p52]